MVRPDEVCDRFDRPVLQDFHLNIALTHVDLLVLTVW